MLFCLACEDNINSDFSPTASEDNGRGGSLARFAIRGDHLYTVDRNTLNVFDITDAGHPTKMKNVMIGTQIETIFPRENHLFIGSQEGMYIYDISTPTEPKWLSTYQHIISCDPVVADERYAYVTLRSVESVCGRFTDQLDIVDISDLTNPFLQISYPMTHPKGLGVDGNELFVCDDGLKVFDISHIDSLVMKYHFHIEANDIIPYRDHLMVIGEDGLYQYSYANDTIRYASHLPFIPVP